MNTNLSPIGFATWMLISGLFIGVTGTALWRGIATGDLPMITSAALTAFAWGGIIAIRFGRKS